MNQKHRKGWMRRAGLSLLCFMLLFSGTTACCAQGIEFSPKEEYRYPDAFPQEGEMIAVTGVFDTYEEGRNTYCTIRDADIYA